MKKKRTKTESKKKKILFVLPGRGTKPVGGFKIVYEYANYLVQNNFEVSLLHVAWMSKTNSLLEGIGRYFYCLFFYDLYKKWFTLDKRVKNKWIFSTFSWLVPTADFVIATSWESAELVAEFDETKGHKLYLIQCDESEFTYVIKKGMQSRVIHTWKLPLHKIVICSWLAGRMNTLGEQSTVIFNGLNFKDFFVERPIQKRNPTTVMMLYHNSPHKGSNDGLQAFRILKEQYPDLDVILFGVPKRPTKLESWIRYYQKPDRNLLRRLYNEAAIFVSPSYSEGWGLPVSEAMQCGCATVTTDIGGFKDFVKENVTSLCFRPGDIEGMVEKISSLFEEDDQRVNLANKGNENIQLFTWERATLSFINLLTTFKSD